MNDLNKFARLWFVAIALAVVVARRIPRRALGARDLPAGFLALAHQLQDLSVEFVDPATQVFERSHENTLYSR